MISQRRYLVTGGTGFIGSALVHRLLALGAQVRVLDDDSRGSPRRLAEVLDRVEIIRGDVRDAQVVRAAARGVDVLCHLAFVNGTQFFYEKPELVLDVGVKGMVNVLDACATHGIRRFILASSSEVYQTPPVIPTPEDVPLVVPDATNPRYSYGAGKLISEVMAINYGRLRLTLHIPSAQRVRARHGLGTRDSPVRAAHGKGGTGTGDRHVAFPHPGFRRRDPRFPLHR